MFKASASIALFSTSINRNLLSISPSVYVRGNDGEYPTFICFQEIYDNQNDIVLTIGWSSGRIQYFPIS